MSGSVPSVLYDHVTIVGGTGMLLGASVYLGQRSRVLTAVARKAASHTRLKDALKQSAVRVQNLQLDYRDLPALIEAFDTSMNSGGPPQLALAWVHGMAPALELARRISAQGEPFTFYHVLGSAMADPTKSRNSIFEEFRGIPGISYRTIQLGFMLTDVGARWLTNDEISRGVINAIERGADRSTIGVVRPWSARPGAGSST